MSIRKLLFIAALAVGHSGCASIPNAVVPNTIAPEFEHISHVSQHAPFTARATDYGANVASLSVNWNVGKSAYLTLSEGIDLDRHYVSTNSCGEIIGPREEFTARIGYKFTVRK